MPAADLGCSLDKPPIFTSQAITQITAFPVDAGIRCEILARHQRNLTVADALDALTSDRPYRVAMSFPAAVHTIEAGAGYQFDPAVIRALRSCSPAIAALLTVMGKPRAMPLEVIKEPAV